MAVIAPPLIETQVSGRLHPFTLLTNSSTNLTKHFTKYVVLVPTIGIPLDDQFPTFLLTVSAQVTNAGSGVLILTEGQDFPKGDGAINRE